MNASVGRAWRWILAAPGAGVALAVSAAAWLFLASQLAYFAVEQPIYSPIDEFNHYFYIQHLYYLHRPPALNVVVHFTTDPQAPPAFSIPPSRGLGVPTFSFIATTEGIQPPGYYALMVPVLALTRHGSYGQIIAIRLATAALAGLIVPLTFLLGRIAVPTAPWVWAAASVLTTLSRGYSFNLSQITNDALAVAVGGIAAVIFLWLARARIDWRWGLVAGLTAGVAIATKVTIYYVPIALALVFLYRVLRQRFMGEWIPAALVAFLSAGLFAIPWFGLQLYRYHALTPRTDWATAPAVLLPYHNIPLVRTFQLILDLGSLKFWIGETGAAAPPLWLFSVGEAGLALCMVGYVTRPLWRERPLPPIVLVGAWSVLGLLTLTAIVLLSQVAILNGRYLYPLFGPIAVVLAAGADRLGWLGRWLFAATVLVLGYAAVVGLLDAVAFVGRDCHC